MPERSGRDETSGGAGPIRVGEAVEESEARQEAERRREVELSASWASVVFGWLAALGAGLILSGVVAAVLGVRGIRGGAEGGTAGLVGLLMTLFLAFLIGGYVAGRMASRSGTRRGFVVALLALVVTMALATAGSFLVPGLVNDLSSFTLPYVPNDVHNVGTVLTIGGILALLLPFVGGAVSGRGARTDSRRPRESSTQQRTTRSTATGPRSPRARRSERSRHTW